MNIQAEHDGKKFRPIKLKLILSVIVISFITTVVFVSINFYRQYHKDLEALDQQIDLIRETLLPSLTSALWSVDIQTLDEQATNIVRNKNFVKISISDFSGKIVTEKYHDPNKIGPEGDKENLRTYEFPIFHTNMKSKEFIGNLKITTTIQNIKNEIYDRNLFFIANEIIKIFIISCLILLIIDNVINKNLGRIIAYLEQFNPNATDSNYLDVKKEKEVIDEMDILQAAINKMIQQINILNKIKQSKISEQEIDIRKQKEIELELLKRRDHLEKLINERTAELQLARDTAEKATVAISEQYHELGIAKEQLTLRTSQLESINTELESFSYSVSHDLRAPLRGIDGWSLALQDDYGHVLDEKAQKYIDRVRSEAQRMGELIDDLLRLAQVTRTEKKLETVNLSELANVVIKRLIEASPERIVKFSIQPNLTTRGDSHLLEIVLTNLLNNAHKFTSKVEEANIEFSLTKFNGRDVYLIRDNGAGFNMTSAKKLFEVFQRIHKQSEFPGTGVGLAMVKRIINLHQGKIWAESTVGRGASFYFTINE